MVGSDGGKEIESEGLFRAPPVTVIVGEEVHATVLKALALLGFGRSRVHSVLAGSQGRMKPSQIPRLPGPLIVCTQVGNVNTGACDPVGEICDFASRRHGCTSMAHSVSGRQPLRRENT
jgi:glutamate/tyrosine decarboxylase-like PLP-dependent enzyme